MDVSSRAISTEHNLKITIVDLTQSLTKIVELHQTNPLATIVLGKITLANALLGLELKNNEITTSTISTNDGLIKTTIAEFQNDRVRSFISDSNFVVTGLKPEKKLDELLSQIVGKEGTLTVARSTVQGEPYVSRVSLTDGSIDRDYMEYLRISSQVNSFISTNVELDDDFKIKSAVGILIQLLPNYKEEDVDYLIKTIGNTAFINKILVKTTNYVSLIEEIATDAIVLESKELKFQCTCSREKTIVAVKLLGVDAVDDIIKKNETVEVICDFCKTKYEITPEELKD